jgi:hypothetical protein
MPMRLIVRTAVLMVTSGIAVTALLVGPHGGIPPWGMGLVLSIVLLAVAAGAALDVAEWKGQRVKRPAPPAPKVPAAVKAATTLLCPLRVCFTLNYKTSGDVLAQAFSTAGASGANGAREVMTDDALHGWLDRYSGFGEWPIKRPVEMTIEIDFRDRTDDSRRRGQIRFQRLFSDPPVEVKSVSRVEDRLFQDNDVAGWMISNRTGTAWTVADLAHATIRVKTVYLSFDDEDFREPPRFEALHLCFGDPPTGVFTFTAAQLAAPAVRQDPAPLMRGPFFKTLLMEYELSVGAIALAEQLAGRDREFSLPN